MRDSITTLEKCLDYNSNLTIENVIKVTSGGVTEETMLQLTQYILNKDTKSGLLYFNNIYMSGIDVSLFLKLYIEFIQNCTKYLITAVPDITILSDISINWLSKNSQSFDKFCYMLDTLLAVRTNYSSEDLKIIVESWLVKVCKL